ncbi:MAG: sodium-dependent transporter [Bacteroidia bacterium]
MATRSGFSSRIGFIAAAAGSAVGLGNIWKFPYETGQNGGAAFLIMYLICIFLIGFPVMVGEIAIGRRTQLNPYGAYKKLGGKGWGLLGLWGILCGAMILSFYNVVAGWAFGYFIETGFGSLLSAPDHSAYFGDYVASINDNLIYSLIFMALTAFIVIRGVQGGIEAASKILMPMLYVILIGLIIYAVTLPGASEGLAFYFNPDFSKLNFATVYSAMGQAFFSLSLGMGALITYGSYISKKENILDSAAIVSVADTSVAVLAGLLIFPLVFSQGLEPGAGPGLVFVTLPGVFQAMGGAGVFVGAIFFLLLSVAALTSTISLLEVPTAFLVDQYKMKRPLAVSLLAGLIFLIGLPSMLSQGAVESLGSFVEYGGKAQDFLTVIGDIFNEVGLPLGGFLMCLFIALKWKKQNLEEEVAIGNPGYKTAWIRPYLNVMITIVCPVVLGFVTIFSILDRFFGKSPEMIFTWLFG